MAETQLKILAVAPSLASLLGHDYEYHQSLHEGFAKIGVDYKVLCPTKTTFTPPAHCIPCLIYFKSGKSIFRKAWTRFVNFFLFLIIFAKQFTQRVNSSAQTVLFIESFRNPELLAFLFCSVLFGKGATIAILLRNEPALYRFKGRPLIFFLKCLLKIIKPHRVILFCDSAITQKSFATILPTPVHLLPIPHTFIHKKTIASHQPILRCWWPGSPRILKGLNIIQKLVATPAQQKIILALSAATPLPEDSIGKHVILEKLPEVLSREEYIQQMLAADFLLLPYDPIQYRSSTSGIFVEGVISGAMPLVTAGTWMAEELKAHHLPELISPFDISNLWEQIFYLAGQTTVFERLNKMAKNYHHFHNATSFAQLFKSAVTIS